MDEPDSTNTTPDTHAPAPDHPPLATSVPTAATPKQPRAERGGGGAGRTIAVGLLVVLLGFGGGVGGFLAADAMSDDDASTTSPQASGNSSAKALQPSNASSSASEDPVPVSDSVGAETPRKIYADVSPAVVHINSKVVSQSTSLFGFGQEQESIGTGSGFIIDAEKGYIVTNAHVVENAKEMEVSFGTDATVKAKLIGADPSTDVAVIQIDTKADALDKVKGGLKSVQFGDSNDLQVGDPVVAIGNPFSLDRTLTTGVVSALQREIPALNEFQIDDVIQTDAAVNPGNSGGPLLNTKGEVIGINSQIQSRGGGFDGIAFAVPSETASRVAQELIKSGKIEYAWLGVSGGELTPALANEYNLDITKGVLVGEVTAGSPAAKAGLSGGTVQRTLGGEEKRSGGDVIISFGGEAVTSMREVADVVDGKKPGDEIEVVYLHDGKKKSTKVELGIRPNTKASTQG